MKYLKRTVHLLEDGMLITLLVSMIVLACGQIILRNFFDMGILWVDPLLRVLVLWTGLIGATIASRENKHIRIDLLSRFFSRGLHMFFQIFIGLFTAAVCSVIAWYGAQWVLIDFQQQLTAFAGVPNWILEIIIPVAFGLIALRYMMHSLCWFLMLVHRKNDENFSL